MENEISIQPAANEAKERMCEEDGLIGWRDN
jgi:hypothetical protein